MRVADASERRSPNEAIQPTVEVIADFLRRNAERLRKETEKRARVGISSETSDPWPRFLGIRATHFGTDH